jgi:hypothetical protein
MSEVPQFPWWLQLFFAVAAVVGPFVGIFVGHWLGRSWQRKQWLMDNRKEECRELSSGLSAAHSAIADIAAQKLTGNALISGEDERNAWRLRIESYRLLRNRIFLAHELKKENLLARWLDATQRVDHGRMDLQEFTKVYGQINDAIVALAMKSPSH